jgi:phage terminase small subunit
MGRKALPIDILVLQGKKNLGKKEIEKRRKAEASLKVEADNVEAPFWLSPEAADEFNRLVGELTNIGLITNIDVSQLAMYCHHLDTFIKHRHELTIKEMDTLSKQIRSWSVEFGFTPSSRAKLAMPKKEEKEVSPEEKRFGEV